MLVAVLAVPIIIVITKDLDYSILNKEIVSANGTEYSFVKNLFKVSPTEIISGLGWGLGYFGMPHILVRFMAFKKPSMAKKAATVAIIWVSLALGAVIFIALFGRILIGEELLANGKQSMIFVELSRMLFPAAISGILLSAIIAASMSTADSQLLVASSSFTSDIYKPLVRKNASDNEILWVGRGVVILIAIIAYFIASSEGNGAQAIMNLVENAWAGFGSSFGAVILLSIFWRRFTYKGALAGVIAGAVTNVLWLIFLSDPTGIYELIPGFAVSMIAATVATLLDKEPSKEITDIFDAATSPCEE